MACWISNRKKPASAKNSRKPKPKSAKSSKSLITRSSFKKYRHRSWPSTKIVWQNGTPRRSRFWRRCGPWKDEERMNEIRNSNVRSPKDLRKPKESAGAFGFIKTSLERTMVPEKTNHSMSFTGASLATFVLLGGLCVACAQVLAQDVVIAQASRFELEGNFQQAAMVLEQGLHSQGIAPVERKKLEFELDRLERIKKDFPYTKEALFKELKHAVKKLSKAEYDHWISEGRFDSRPIDGQHCFMSSSVANLFFRYPELNERRIPAKFSDGLEKAYRENCVAIKKASQEQNQTYVLPKRFHVTMKVTAGPGAAPKGE